MPSCAVGAPALRVCGAGRRGWWEWEIFFMGVWLAEFAALERIVQHFACEVQRQQTSQVLSLV